MECSSTQLGELPATVMIFTSKSRSHNHRWKICIFVLYKFGIHSGKQLGLNLNHSHHFPHIMYVIIMI